MEKSTIDIFNEWVQKAGEQEITSRKLQEGQQNWVAPEHIKREPLTEEDYMIYSPTIVSFAWAILEARKDLEQEGYAIKIEGSKREIEK